MCPESPFDVELALCITHILLDLSSWLNPYESGHDKLIIYKLPLNTTSRGPWVFSDLEGLEICDVISDTIYKKDWLWRTKRFYAIMASIFKSKKSWKETFTGLRDRLPCSHSLNLSSFSKDLILFSQQLLIWRLLNSEAVTYMITILAHSSTDSRKWGRKAHGSSFASRSRCNRWLYCSAVLIGGLLQVYVQLVGVTSGIYLY